MSWNQKTCKEGTVCKDAIGTEVKVGDKVAFIRFGSFYTGLIKKICLHDNGKILWIPGVKKSKFDRQINEEYDIIIKYIKKENNDEKK